MASGSWDYEFQSSLRMIENFRIQDLQAVLTRFSSTPLRGSTRKADLQKRVRDLLTSTNTRNAVVEYVQAINRQRSVQVAAPPAPQPQRAGVMMQQPYARPGLPQAGWPQPRIPMQNRAVPPLTTNSRQGFSSSNPMMRNQVNYNPNLFMCPSVVDPKNVHFTVLPFYEQKEVVMPHTLLPQYPKIDNGMVQHSFKFCLPRKFFNEFRVGADLPRYEVQLRMCVADASKPQSDAFPNVIRTYINQSSVQYPPLMNVQAPPGQGVGQIQKRSSRSVDITQNCIASRANEFSMIMEYQPDRHQYVFGIWVVYHLTAKALTEKIEGCCPKYYDETRNMIKKLLGGGEEDDIAMDVCRISLLCPLARILMKTPARGKSCTHLQCFDLTNYIMMNEKRANWKCPVCNRQTLPSELVVDYYFVEIINKINGQSSEVELLRDGSWKMIKEADDEDSRPSSPKRSRVEPTPTTQKTVETGRAAQNQDIITLDDSDEEDEQVPPTPAPAEPQKTGDQQPPSASTQKVAGEQNVIDKNTSGGSSVIYLSDDDSATENAPKDPAPNSSSSKPAQPQNSNSLDTSLFGGNQAGNHRPFSGELIKDSLPTSLLSNQAMADISLELVSFLQKLQHCEIDFNRI
ncbi:unnamed protein product [Bursaphelenchus xylophilus]|uniref:(pine wood nematode) hypothetical protein n=1 Tax=Bursaphelenchus xylophilus TaxID=6326 RepID=A0A1I7S778_BURXY|nr:unnamed protein product [Bursaphelenchus xylophilus]CAG9084720.1 unnamed protein product [Bursaphelenchus xylophilus]